MFSCVQRQCGASVLSAAIVQASLFHSVSTHSQVRLWGSPTRLHVRAPIGHSCLCSPVESSALSRSRLEYVTFRVLSGDHCPAFGLLYQVMWLQLQLCRCWRPQSLLLQLLQLLLLLLVLVLIPFPASYAAAIAGVAHSATC